MPVKATERCDGFGGGAGLMVDLLASPMYEDVCIFPTPLFLFVLRWREEKGSKGNGYRVLVLSSTVRQGRYQCTMSAAHSSTSPEREERSRSPSVPDEEGA